MHLHQTNKTIHCNKTIRFANSIVYLALILTLLLSTTGSVFAQGITFSGAKKTQESSVELLATPFEISSEPGARIILVKLTPTYGQYAYANDPGETIGLPTVITPIFKTPIPAPNASIIYPLGKQIADIYSGGQQVNVYDEAVNIYVYIPPQKEVGSTNSTASPEGYDLDVDLSASLLMCSIKNCSPVKRILPIKINADDKLPNAESETWWADFLESREILENTLPSINPIYDNPNLEIEGLAKALLFGFIAGFILNFMPCVFPVVSLKLLSIIVTLNDPDSEKRLTTFRHQNIMFALGVIVWFTVLSGLLSTLDLLWGQLFQSQVTLIGMLLLIFGLTLSMFGLFMLPAFAFREKQGRVTKRSAFITGMLATCLATPCSGPLLGGVLGWSFNQPQPILGLVFMTVGLGMASPYLFLAAFPKMGRYFPKPGPWLNKLEAVLGFFLLATCAYLFSLLTGDIRIVAFLAMLALSILGLLWGKRQNAKGMGNIFYWRWLLGCIIALFVFIALWNFVLSNNYKTLWVPYTEKAFIEAKNNKNIVLNFTADWCPNCKLLERTVFTEKRVEDWQQRYDVVFMQIDLTHDNPEGYEFLAALNSNSIPLVALFPKQTTSSELKPVVLRDVFGPTRLEEAAKKAWTNQED